MQMKKGKGRNYNKKNQFKQHLSANNQTLKQSKY